MQLNHGYFVIVYHLMSFLQHALRLYAFRQIHKILGVEPLKASPKNLKRQLSNGGVEDTEESDSKVTKKSE